MNDDELDAVDFAAALAAAAPEQPTVPLRTGVEVERLARRQRTTRRYSAVAGATLIASLVVGGAYSIGDNEARPNDTATGPTTNPTTAPTTSDIKMMSACPEGIEPGEHASEVVKPPAGAQIVRAAYCRYQFFTGIGFELASASVTRDRDLVERFAAGVRRSSYSVPLYCPNIPADQPANPHAYVVVLDGREGATYFAQVGPFCVIPSYAEGPARVVFPSRMLQGAIHAITHQ